MSAIFRISSCNFLSFAKTFIPAKIQSFVFLFFKSCPYDPKYKIVMNGAPCDVRQFMCCLLRNGGYRNPLTQSETFTLEEYKPVFEWLNKQPRKIEWLDKMDQRVLDLIFSESQMKFYASVGQGPPLCPPFPFEAEVNPTHFFEIWKGSEYMYFPKFTALLIRMRIAPEIILSFKKIFCRQGRVGDETRSPLYAWCLAADKVV